MEPRKPYRPIGDNPDPREIPQIVTPSKAPSPDNNPNPGETAPDANAPLPRSEDDDPAHDASAAPDD